jgi:hypothetical protein
VLTSNGTTNESGHGGTAVWTECTGQENHQHDNSITNTWTAPAARIQNLTSSGKNVLAAGDTVFASSDHAETQNTGNISFTLGGYNTGPIRIISVDRTKSVPPLPADPNPVSGASWTNSGGGSFSPGAFLEIWGFTIASAPSFQLNCATGGILRLMNSTIQLTASNAAIGYAGSGGGRIEFENVTVNFNNTNQSFKLNATNGGIFRWRNVSTQPAVSGTVPTALFSTNTSGQVPTMIFLDGLDLSSLGSATVTNSAAIDTIRFFVTNCKLGSGFLWAVSSTLPGATSELVNCDSGNTNYKNARYDGFGSALTTDTTVTMTGGATDGVTPYAHKMVTVATDQNVLTPLESFQILKWNSTTGSAVTAAIQLLATSTLKMSDVWMEAEYLSDSGSPLGSFVSTFPNILDSTTPMSAGTGSWNNPPASPVTLQMSTTFTPNQVGWIRGFVKLAKTSTTVWINPAFQ